MSALQPMYECISAPLARPQTPRVSALKARRRVVVGTRCRAVVVRRIVVVVGGGQQPHAVVALSMDRGTGGGF